ncbi:hypothetical protein RND81_04G187600 [Saponaria officinalis]|uniref:Hemerythrin-like domain-containing protein n=1 Tax=Saponaria officinalis TaxID=3572 RepID=A0AAW1LMC5_SAPOF
MGNCFTTKKSTNKHFSEITPSSFSDNFSLKQPPPPPQPPLVFLHGDSSNSATHFLRFALRFKPLTLRFIPSSDETPPSTFTLRFEKSGDAVTGTADTVLRFADSKLPHPPLLRKVDDDVAETTSFEVVRMVELQHRSVRWHVERVARWTADLATRGGKEAVDPRVGTPKMEVNKLGKNYGKLVEVLQEHAQMEERIIFPFLEAHDQGVCRCVNEEHARDLPIMNGIKEDIKSIGVMNIGTPTHREALYSLSARLKTLQENCRDHFNEEERNLVPILEGAELTREQQKKIVEQCMDVMQGTHSHLFRFFIEGLLPHEAIEYLDVIMACVNNEKASSMLHLLVD